MASSTTTKTPKAKTPKTKATTKVSRTTKTTPTTSAPAVQSPAPAAPVQSSLQLSSQLHPGLTPMSADQYVQQFEALSGQERDAQLMAKRADVDKAYAVAQGKAIQVQVENAKNLVTAEAINLQTAKLSYAQTQTQLEQVKVQSVQIDVAGEQALLPHKQQAWDIRSQEMAIDNQGATSLLEPRQQHWNVKLQLAQTELARLQQQVQLKLTEVNAPIEIKALN